MKITLNKQEYSRYNADLKTVRVRIRDIPLATDYYIQVYDTQRLIPIYCKAFNPNSDPLTLEIDLESEWVSVDPNERSCIDALGLCWSRQGRYVIRILDATMVKLAESDPWYIAIVPLEEFKKTYLFGLPLYAEYSLMVVNQPKTIKGVQVSYIDIGTLKGESALMYDPNATIPTLAWRAAFADEFGDPVPIEDGTTIVRLVSAEKDAYIECSIDSFELLEVSSIEPIIETFMIDNQRMSDQALRDYLFDATNTIETEVQVSIELRICTTDPGDPRVTYYDRVVKARDHFKPRIGINMYTIKLNQLYTSPLRHVYQLTGRYAETEVIVMPQEWMVINPKGGIIDMVPAGVGYLQSMAVPSVGLSLLRPQNLVTNFWHFTIASGFADLQDERSKLREAIGKKAAVLVLADLGLAISGGKSSNSAGRDNITSSWAFANGGAYIEKIQAYQAWLDSELPRMKLQYRGPIMEIL